MRALLVLVLLASAARADDELAAKLENSIRFGRTECLELFDRLRERGDAATTRIPVVDYHWVILPGRQVRRSHVRMLAGGELYAACAARARNAAVYSIRIIVAYAAAYPEVWREACNERWPRALAKGVRLSDRYAPLNHELSSPLGTSLGDAYQRYCVGG